MNERRSREIQTIKNIFRIVDVLVDRDGAQVTEISSELGLAKNGRGIYLYTVALQNVTVEIDSCYLDSIPLQ